MEQTKEKKYIVGSIICGLLTAFGIAASVISLVGGSRGIWLVVDCAALVLLFLIVYYSFVGYKKAHGNLLKCIILLYAMFNLTGFPALVQDENVLFVIILATVIGLICYVAGRLAKAKENLILMIAILVCIIAMTDSQLFSTSVTIGVITPLIIWLDICVAYFLRYKQHKEAGLEDAPKK